MQVWHVLLIIFIILAGILVALYFVGRRLEKRQAEQQQQIEAAKQQMTLLIIDKKRLPVRESGLPQYVIDQVPRLMRRNKMPIVKVKAGPRIMTMVADERIFDIIPLKKEVKATVSGIYITDIRAVHGKLETPPPKKKSLGQKLTAWRDRTQAEIKNSSKK
ncbi:MAG: hypothetical protein Q4G47_00410 [Lachnospiraceae bacterium]|nr:hypothetical protein [Lachnospiraceae bacterium]